MLVTVPLAVSLRGLGYMYCPNGEFDADCYDVPDGGPVDTPAVIQPVQLPPVQSGSSSSGSSAADLAAIAQITSSAAKAINAAQGPYVVPGTNAIYNPATGQLMSSAGLSLASGVTPSVASAAGSIMMPVLVLGVLALFIFGRK